jgi:hypothetical protein
VPTADVHNFLPWDAFGAPQPAFTEAFGVYIPVNESLRKGSN